MKKKKILEKNVDTRGELSAEAIAESLVVGNLKSEVSPSVFESRLLGYSKLERRTEGSETEKLGLQRDQSCKFVWGHSHDFGSFKIEGKMRSRHIKLFNMLLEKGVFSSLAGKHVADMGCWTGGMSLLLSTAGASVYCVDEVIMYLNALVYIADSFSLPLEASTVLETCELDCVLMLGFVYHVTDMIAHLRSAFTALKDGGTLVIETLLSKQGVEYYGPGVVAEDSGFGRTGWTWFVPSKAALSQMLQDVGFDAPSVTDLGGKRALIIATRSEYKSMMFSGLTTPRIDKGDSHA